MRRRASLGLISVLAAALVAGCGGSATEEDGEATGDAGSLNRQEYVRAGDRICAEGTTKMAQEALERFEGGQPSRAEAREFGQEVVAPTLEDQLAQLRALPPPAGDEERINAVYDAVEAGIAKLRDDPELFTQPNTAGAFDRANRLAQRYGFTQCGSG